jgi:hypothetical protein
MADPLKGFKTFAANKGIRITPVQHKFPEKS